MGFLLLVVMPLWGDVAVDVGAFDIGGTTRRVHAQGLFGGGASSADQKALHDALRSALGQAGHALMERPVRAEGDLGTEQQQALELELLFGLDAEAERRAEALLRFHLGRPSLLTRHHERYCRLLLAAARAFQRAAKPQRMEQQLVGLAGCEEEPLLTQPWLDDALRDAWVGVRREGTATLTVRGAFAGAQAWLDGVPLGVLPVQILKVPAGVHDLQIQDGAQGRSLRVDLAADARKTVELRPGFQGAKGLDDLVVSAADAQALGRALMPSGGTHGVAVFGAGRKGFVGLVYNQAGRVAVVEAPAVAQLVPMLVSALDRLEMPPQAGVRLRGLSRASGLPQRDFMVLRGQTQRGVFEPVPEALETSMVGYAAQKLGSSSDALRARLKARRRLRQSRARQGQWLGSLAMNLAQGPNFAMGAATALWRLQPWSSSPSFWWVLGAELEGGGASADPAGTGWDPLLYPVDPITGSEAGLHERVRFDGSGVAAARGLLGLAWGDLRKARQVMVVAHGGWRRVRGQLVHEQFVEGVPDSAVELRRSDAFDWDGWSGGARLLLWQRVGAWHLGLQGDYSVSGFAPVELDLWVPGTSATGTMGLLVGRRF
jgi:hypothetical protein